MWWWHWFTHYPELLDFNTRSVVLVFSLLNAHACQSHARHSLLFRLSLLLVHWCRVGFCYYAPINELRARYSLFTNICLLHFRYSFSSNLSSLFMPGTPIVSRQSSARHTHWSRNDWPGDFGFTTYAQIGNLRPWARTDLARAIN